MRYLLAVIGLALAGCGGGDDEGPPPSIGERMCMKIDQCPDLERTMTFSGCTEFMDDLFGSQTLDCGQCAESLTCDSLTRWLTGEREFCVTVCE